MVPDEALLARVHRFEDQALIEVYDHYSPEIYRYAARLLGNQQLAEDCVGETFSRFLLALKNNNGPQQYLRAYLYRVAHNWITDYYRRNRFTMEEISPDQPADGVADLLEGTARRAEQQELRRALMLLTAEQRQVIVLKYLEDWDNESIARALAKPVGAIKALQHRGLNGLKRLLLQEEMEEVG
jgi:RNA polymerase sigma-70 factor (ECF subfamily)